MYTIRLVVAGHYLRAPPGAGLAPAAQDALLEARRDYLTLGYFTPFSRLARLCRLAHRLTRQHQNGAVVSWSPDDSTCSVFGDPVAVAGFRGLVRSAIDEAEDIL